MMTMEALGLLALVAMTVVVVVLTQPLFWIGFTAGAVTITIARRLMKVADVEARDQAREAEIRIQVYELRAIASHEAQEGNEELALVISARADQLEALLTPPQDREPEGVRGTDWVCSACGQVVCTPVCIGINPIGGDY